MLTYNFERNSGVPLYEQLYGAVKSDILNGIIKSDEKLPSKRELAAHLGISKVTVEAAYAALIDEGYVYSIEKKGYFCEKNLALPEKKSTPVSAVSFSADEFKVDLSSNAVPKNQFPFSIWSRLTREVMLNYSRELLDPIPYKGVYAFREALCSYLLSSRGMRVSPENIIIGAGSEYLYTQIIRLLGSDKVYGIENPSYHKISEVYSMNNADIRYFDITDHSETVSEIERSDIDIIHISPSHNFPTGRVMGAKIRHDLLSLIGERRNGYIIEDDFDSELRFEGRPIPPMQTIDNSGRVIYINTFSKTISPSMRIGYMILPPDLAAKYSRELSFNSCTVPSFEQYTLAEFISRGYYERHINRTKKYYRILRAELLEEFARSPLSKRSEISESQAGLHFTLLLDTDMPDAKLKEMLAAEGIKASFMSDYVYGSDSHGHELLVNYSGLDREKFRLALDTVCKLLG